MAKRQAGSVRTPVGGSTSADVSILKLLWGGTESDLVGFLLIGCRN